MAHIFSYSGSSFTEVANINSPRELLNKAHFGAVVKIKDNFAYIRI